MRSDDWPNAIRFSRASSNFSFSASSVLASNPASAASSRRFNSSMSSGRSAALRMPRNTLLRRYPATVGCHVR
jgi:hypothetical protein